MSCPTCDYAMELIDLGSQGPVHWCPRCGTLHHKGRDEAPELVAAAREVISALNEIPVFAGIAALRHALGKAEGES